MWNEGGRIVFETKVGKNKNLENKRDIEISGQGNGKDGSLEWLHATAPKGVKRMNLKIKLTVHVVEIYL